MQNKLVNFRVKQKLTQQEMSKKIGTTLTFYSKVELGERNPSYNFIVKLKKEFPNANVDSIFFDNELHEMC
ncbi:helix-turn-helix transcriptional regulator [Clostridium senegalense]